MSRPDLPDVDNPGAVIGVTGEDATDVLVVRSGELRPTVTEPTVIGAVVRIPPDVEVADALALARTVIPTSEWTECLRVVVADADDIGRGLRGRG